ncbi:Ig-like domain-containing protein [Streptomyces sp. NPDC088354]|uniref:L,D-transpeptidase n=1 Tax=unclassified Streptomyces TaxID=2593676 RepID=UPI0029A8A977|nr:Ig-like domain-containing protein [Streptomyces sp. MI02-7b]MDX3072009.1 Ig-like domain-containing protein [Streptomyces sp. MI02-7b]
MKRAETGTANDPRPTRKRGTGLAAIALLAVGAITLTACGGDKADAGTDNTVKSQASVDEAAAQDASDARIAITPKTGADNVSINSGSKVAVTDGKLSAVTMTAVSGGKEIEGTISADGTSWAPNAPLERATQYTIVAKAEDAKGRKATENSTFTTVSAAHSFIGYYTPEAGQTVGVGMPVSINFNKAITDKKAVQSGITVSSSSGQPVVGHWFNGTRLDFRPQNYWTAGSTVTVKLNLDGVEGADGVYGVQEKTVSFKIGRSQVSTVDASTHQMKVVRDGKVIKNIPISAGSDEHTTYNGQMVMSEKFTETRMNGATVGFTDDDGKGEYDIKDVPHAIRLTTSGTFIHGNYWGSDYVFGHVNTSHGCVGLNDTKGAKDTSTDAYWFYQNSIIGDVVIVKNSKDKTVDPANGLNGWNMSWADWKAGSAV